MDFFGLDYELGILGLALLTAGVGILLWGNMFYEIAKIQWNLEETLAWKKTEGWNAAKTSALFLSFLMVMQGLLLYTTIKGAAEPLMEEEKIDHWIELYKVEDTLELLEDYGEEKEEEWDQNWYIERQISGFLERGLMETGIFFIHLGLFFQSLYRGHRKIRLTEKGLYTFEGKKKLSKLSHYKIRPRPKEGTDTLYVYPREKAMRFWESHKEPKKVILEIQRENLSDLEETLRLADVKKEEG